MVYMKYVYFFLNSFRNFWKIKNVASEFQIPLKLATQTNHPLPHTHYINNTFSYNKMNSVCF